MKVARDGNVEHDDGVSVLVSEDVEASKVNSERDFVQQKDGHLVVSVKVSSSTLAVLLY